MCLGYAIFYEVNTCYKVTSHLYGFIMDRIDFILQQNVLLMGNNYIIPSKYILHRQYY